MGLIAFVLLSAVVSMVLAAAIFAAARLLGIRNRRVLLLLVCGALPSALLTYAAWRLMTVKPPTAGEAALTMAGQLTDPGPAAFAEAMMLGVFPACLYAIFSIPIFNLLSKRLGA